MCGANPHVSSHVAEKKDAHVAQHVASSTCPKHMYETTCAATCGKTPVLTCDLTCDLRLVQSRVAELDMCEHMYNNQHVNSNVPQAHMCGHMCTQCSIQRIQRYERYLTSVRNNVGVAGWI